MPHAGRTTLQARPLNVMRLPHFAFAAQQRPHAGSGRAENTNRSHLKQHHRLGLVSACTGGAVVLCGGQVRRFSRADKKERAGRDSSAAADASASGYSVPVTGEAGPERIGERRGLHQAGREGRPRGEGLTEGTLADLKGMTRLSFFGLSPSLWWWLLACHWLFVRPEDAIVSRSDIAINHDISLMYDPPSGFFSPTALGVYVQVNALYQKTAKIYYAFEYIDAYSTISAVKPQNPTLSSPYSTFDRPYIHMNTPFGAHRNRTLTIVAVIGDSQSNYQRSLQHTLWFIVEAGSRPNSFGFLVPGVETGGYFVKFIIEMSAAARAQASGGQEFADFYTPLGVGTYQGQIYALPLTKIDKDLTGFEGGFAVNCSDSRHYGILVPFHNGVHYTGKVVRVDLQAMSNITYCMHHYRTEYLDANNHLVTKGPLDACIVILDLASKHPNARGFRRGFVGNPYVYLSPSEFSVAVRLDVCNNFGIQSTQMLDLSKVDVTLGGYAGGFVDGNWACYNPMKTFVGPFGGLRSSQAVDNGHLRVYFHGRLACIEHAAWTNHAKLNVSLQTLDFSDINPELRGFSEAIRVGRYAYFAPLASSSHEYTSQLVRIHLGDVDIGTTLKEMSAPQDIVTILDLTQKDRSLKGYSGIFNYGQYLFLVPFRNTFEPKFGQRGHGNIVRLDMNHFSVDGLQVLDMVTAQRDQIPSTPDSDLRGFCAGFPSGKYILLVPFYNGRFSGKVARLIGRNDPLDTIGNLQELDMTEDRARNGTYKAFRGGFVSLWQGALGL